jgi:hypothetical protein
MTIPAAQCIKKAGIVIPAYAAIFACRKASA